MKLNINKKLVATILTGAISLSLIGSVKAEGSMNDNNVELDPAIEFLLDSNDALNNIHDDYEEVLKIADIYFEARESCDLDKVKEFYDNMREIYLNYDATKARKAQALLPYFIEAEVLFKNTGYAFNKDEVKLVDQIYPLDQLINGYTIPEFEELYNVQLQKPQEDEIIFDYGLHKTK